MIDIRALITGLQEQRDAIDAAIIALVKIYGTPVMENVEPQRTALRISAPIHPSKTDGAEGKTCSVCGKTKPAGEFPIKGRRCKECISKYMKEWYAKNHPRNPPREPLALSFSCQTCRAKFLSKASLKDHHCLGKIA